MRKHAEPIIGNDNGNVEIPVLLDMPVQQPSAGNLYLGFEPKAGDECMVLFSEREIESAKQVGGTYPLRYSRMHNLSDGVVVPFCISEGKARDLTENGVSLLQCFQDLAALVRNIALESTPSNALRAGEVLQLIQKIEDAR